MVKEDFINALNSPQSGLIGLRDDLVKVTSEYPWFSIGHILLCKCDHLQSHIDLDRHLQKAAVYANSRTALYEYLTKERLEAQVKSFEQELVGWEESTDQQEEAEEVIFTESEPISEENVVLVEEPTVLEAVEVKESQELEEIVDVEESTLPIRKASEFDDLQREILLEAISSSIELEAGEAEEADEKMDGVVGQEEDIKEQNHNLSAYAMWLKSRAKGSTFGVDPQPIAEAQDPKRKQQALIDRFITTSPKITPGKADQFRTDDLARLSLIEDVTFVTETMARIYADQGQFAKAIKAYNVLSLKFPEKSVYFANQIKKLQERRKSTK